MPASKIHDQVVFENAKGRQILFSTFHPDAARLIRKLQSTYPVSADFWVPIDLGLPTHRLLVEASFC